MTRDRRLSTIGRCAAFALLAALLVGASAQFVSGAAAQTLEEALVLAYQNNPALQAERARLRAVDEEVPEALAGWRPTIEIAGDVGALYSNTDGMVPNSGSQTVAPLRRGPLGSDADLPGRARRRSDRVGREPRQRGPRPAPGGRAIDSARRGDRLHGRAPLRLRDRAQPEQRAGGAPPAAGGAGPARGRRGDAHRRGSGRGQARASGRGTGNGGGRHDVRPCLLPAGDRRAAGCALPAAGSHGTAGDRGGGARCCSRRQPVNRRVIVCRAGVGGGNRRGRGVAQAAGPRSWATFDSASIRPT